MKKKIVLAAILVLAAGVLPAGAMESMAAVNVEKARVFAVAGGGTLTVGSGAAPEAVLGDYLRSLDLGSAAIDSVSVINRFRNPANGLTHLRGEQVVDGLSVYGSEIKAAFNADGALIHLIENLAPVSAVRAARITADEAVTAAIDHHAKGGLIAQAAPLASDFYYQRPNARAVAVPMADGSLAEGYLVVIWTRDDNLLYHTLVSGTGQVLANELRTNTDSYNIFPNHPLVTAQTVTAGPGAGNAESPIGWLGAGSQTSQDISGNNVHAYLDRDANNSPDGTGTTVTSGNFVTAANLSQAPTTSQNQDVAVQNLFYLNNVIHDKLYKHGFNEAARNFQNNNFGNGGVAGDAVNAEAQDGSGTNNANFSTPSDGSPGRMQMFLWTSPNPDRDGDVDSDIVYHEYGHGLTWRMIGSMSGGMSGAIGEGMADCLALLMNGDPLLAEYSANDFVNGLRSEPAETYSRTYGDFSGSSVHFNGEIYGAICWRLKEIFNRESISEDTLWDYIVGGMNFTPAGPAFENMRDGILAAASGSGNECLIWEGFADYGVGVGAKATVKGGGSRITISESFAVPASCAGCTPTEPSEVTCNDGLDNDCDGFVDGADPDCATGCSPVGAACVNDGDCCSNKCKGPAGGKTCK
jgi:Zn-dependent metalloprotease